MARRRIRVKTIKEVIRYGVTTGLSERAIGRALKVSLANCQSNYRPHSPGGPVSGSLAP